MAELSAQAVDFYDVEWTQQWQDMKTFSPVARHTRRLIRNLLNHIPYRSLIDIGCGNGALLRELPLDTTQIHICGVDFSEVAVRLAQQQTPGQFHCLDIQNTSLQETFDVGICSEVLEHLDNDEAALSNIRTMCKQVIITVPSGPLGPSSAAMGHVRHYTKESLTQKLTQAGFTVCQIRAWGTPFHDPLYAWLRGQAPEGATTGNYGYLRRAMSYTLYLLFFFNLLDRGHKLIALAERTQDLS
ncbi:MAG: class I SAM-dependent methyltransferase [bacterium]|nr:class I SAM-dependent methyltransferase [bacterium]